jgi:hypothetical protein
MSTATITPTSRHEVTLVRRRSEAVRVGRLGLGTVGVLIVLISAFAGVVAYAGPILGYHADGSGSWHWDQAHTLLALLPGAVGVLIGLAITAEARGIVLGRGRLTLAFAGFIVILCGAWFAVGPLALPVITNHGPYFEAARPFRLLMNELGYSIGPAVLLTMAGGFVAGWSSRHQPRSAPDVVTESASVTPEII